jgi:hypothetical protein
MPRAITDASMMTGSALALVFALVMLDDRVREHVRAVLDGPHPGATLTGLGHSLGNAAMLVAADARTLSLAHAPLVIFAIAAIVLVFCMLRT